jgi:hypothetical protein
MSIFNRAFKHDEDMVKDADVLRRRARIFEKKSKNNDTQLIFEKLIDLYNLSRSTKRECAFTKGKILSSFLNKKDPSMKDFYVYTTNFQEAKGRFQRWLGNDETCVYCRGGKNDEKKNFYWVITPEVNEKYRMAKVFAVTSLQLDRVSRSSGIQIEGRKLKDSKLGKLFDRPEEYPALKSDDGIKEQLLEIKEKSEEIVV